MMKYVLIGGGDIRSGETAKIDQEIVKLCGKDDAKLLFIGLASSYSDSYYDAVKKQYREFGCSCSYLKKSNLINNPNLVIDKIKAADIIYVGGGDTCKLMDRIREFGLDKLLTELDDKMIVGLSAGAIMISKKGLSDAAVLRGESENLDFVEGLGLVNLNICPHYNIDMRKEELKDKLSTLNDKVIGIDDNVALVVCGDKMSVIRGKEDANVYVSYMLENEVVEEVFHGLD